MPGPADADAGAAGWWAWSGRGRWDPRRSMPSQSLSRPSHSSGFGPCGCSQTIMLASQRQRPGRHSPRMAPQVPGMLSTVPSQSSSTALQVSSAGPTPAHAAEHAVHAHACTPGRQGPLPRACPGRRRRPRRSPRRPAPSQSLSTPSQASSGLAVTAPSQRAALPAGAGDHAGAADALAGPAVARAPPSQLSGGAGQAAAGGAGGEAGQPEAVDQAVAVVVLAVAQLGAPAGWRPVQMVLRAAGAVGARRSGPGRHSPMSSPQRTWGTSSTRPLQSSSRPLHTSGLAAQAQDMFSSIRPSQSSSAQSSAVGARQPGAAPQASSCGRARGQRRRRADAHRRRRAGQAAAVGRCSPSAPGALAAADARRCRCRPWPGRSRPPRRRRCCPGSRSVRWGWTRRRCRPGARSARPGCWPAAPIPVPPAAASAFSCGSSTVKPTT